MKPKWEKVKDLKKRIVNYQIYKLANSPVGVTLEVASSESIKTYLLSMPHLGVPFHRIEANDLKEAKRKALAEAQNVAFKKAEQVNELLMFLEGR